MPLGWQQQHGGRSSRHQRGGKSGKRAMAAQRPVLPVPSGGKMHHVDDYRPDGELTGALAAAASARLVVTKPFAWQVGGLGQLRLGSGCVVIVLDRHTMRCVRSKYMSIFGMPVCVAVQLLHVRM